MFIVVQKSCFLDPPSNEFHNQTDSSLLLLIFNHIDIIFSWISVLSLVSLSTTAALWQESRNCLTYCADHINCCEDKTVSYNSYNFIKVEKILKGSLDSNLSPSPSVKIQIMCRKVCLRCTGKTGCCQQTFENKKFVDIALQCFALLPQLFSCQ